MSLLESRYMKVSGGNAMCSHDVCVSVLPSQVTAVFLEVMEVFESAGQSNMYWLSIARLRPRSGSSS